MSGVRHTWTKDELLDHARSFLAEDRADGLLDPEEYCLRLGVLASFVFDLWDSREAVANMLRDSK
jgi:hypothetical protein